MMNEQETHACIKQIENMFSKSFPNGRATVADVGEICKVSICYYFVQRINLTFAGLPSTILLQGAIVYCML
jgi:hypothetical protein